MVGVALDATVDDVALDATGAGVALDATGTDVVSAVCVGITGVSADADGTAISGVLVRRGEAGAFGRLLGGVLVAATLAGASIARA